MFESLLERISDYLDRHDIPYMIVGGQAVLLYGEPRLTKDIDITLGVDADKLESMLAIIESMGLNPLVTARTFTP